METIGYGPYIWLPLLVCVAIAFAAFFCIRRGGWAICPCMAFRPRRGTPIDILEERFARGEIDREDFEERRRTLTAPPQELARGVSAETAAPIRKEDHR